MVGDACRGVMPPSSRCCWRRWRQPRLRAKVDPAAIAWRDESWWRNKFPHCPRSTLGIATCTPSARRRHRDVFRNEAEYFAALARTRLQLRGDGGTWSANPGSVGEARHATRWKRLQPPTRVSGSSPGAWTARDIQAAGPLPHDANGSRTTTNWRCISLLRQRDGLVPDDLRFRARQGRHPQPRHRHFRPAIPAVSSGACKTATRWSLTATAQRPPNRSAAAPFHRHLLRPRIGWWKGSNRTIDFVAEGVPKRAGWIRSLGKLEATNPRTQVAEGKRIANGSPTAFRTTPVRWWLSMPLDDLDHPPPDAAGRT